MSLISDLYAFYRRGYGRTGLRAWDCPHWTAFATNLGRREGELEPRSRCGRQTSSIAGGTRGRAWPSPAPLVSPRAPVADRLRGPHQRSQTTPYAPVIGRPPLTAAKATCFTLRDKAAMAMQA